VLVFRAIASNARRSVFIPISAIFILLGILFVALPKISAYALAVLCAWFALGTAREAFRRRADR
jgi:NADH:ubiquinone oxidoreductase subunit 6 (subunit J)